MLDGFLSICGLIDAAFSAFLVIDPSEAEIEDAEKKLQKLMNVWCAQKMSITLKAHILEHHMVHKIREFGGLGDKAPKRTEE
jgi:hypothetical protein